MPKGRVDSHWISTGLATERLGLTRPRLEQLHKDAVLTARLGDRGRREWLWPDVREQYHDYRLRQALAEHMAKEPRAESKEAAQARLAHAQADKVEFELAKARGEFLGRPFWYRELEGIFVRQGKVTQTLASRFRTRLTDAGLTGDMADSILNEITDYVRRELRLAAEDVDDETDPADDPPAQAA